METIKESLLIAIVHREYRASIEREKQIKGWLRKKKVALIEAMNPLLAQASRWCLHCLNHTRLPARQGLTGLKDDTDLLVIGSTNPNTPSPRCIGVTMLIDTFANKQ